MIPTVDRVCGNCRFWVDQLDLISECHRMPPHPAAVGAASTDARWPIVDPTDWCGEGQAFDYQKGQQP